MKTAIATLKSISPYSQSKNYDAAKLPRELANDFEERTWKERGHWTAEGKLFIPPMQFKNCISDAAKYLGKQVPGKGKNTYTKHFESGIIVPEKRPCLRSIRREARRWKACLEKFPPGSRMGRGCDLRDNR
jgi:hypothetical protein